jgi:hypothetical protein
LVYVNELDTDGREKFHEKLWRRKGRMFSRRDTVFREASASYERYKFFCIIGMQAQVKVRPFEQGHGLEGNGCEQRSLK